MPGSGEDFGARPDCPAATLLFIADHHRTGGELTRPGQAPGAARGDAPSMTSEDSTAQLDLFRRRRELRHALATVEAAIAQHDGDGAETARLAGLRIDLLAALELTELLLARH